MNVKVSVLMFPLFDGSVKSVSKKHQLSLKEAVWESGDFIGLCHLI